MLLPNAAQALVDERKVRDYALNPDHPVGRNKARVFEAALGFNQGNAADLRQQIREGVVSSVARPAEIDGYGVRYMVDIPVVGPKGGGVVRTGWIVRPGTETPTLITLFVV